MADGEIGGLSAAELGSDLRRLQEQYGEAAKSNQALFAAAMERLRAERTGPTTAERLFAISSALSRPTRTGSFVEELGNVGGVLGEQEKTAREAQTERAAMLEKYGMGQGAANLEALKAQLDSAGEMYRAAKTAETAQARAGQPSFQLDVTGQIREVPKTVHRPTTREDYAAIPAGEYYVVPSGSNAGKVILKQAGEGF